MGELEPQGDAEQGELFSFGVPDKMRSLDDLRREMAEASRAAAEGRDPYPERTGDGVREAKRAERLGTGSVEQALADVPYSGPRTPRTFDQLRAHLAATREARLRAVAREQVAEARRAHGSELDGIFGSEAEADGQPDEGSSAEAGS